MCFESTLSRPLRNILLRALTFDLVMYNDPHLIGDPAVYVLSIIRRLAYKHQVLLRVSHMACVWTVYVFEQARFVMQFCDFAHVVS